jgi:glycosyltransferase 2 family protein
MNEQVMVQYDSNRIRSAADERGYSHAINKAAMVAAKLVVTGLCFWYLSRRIEFDGLFSSLRQLEFGWAAAAPLIVILQTPFVAMRWREVLKVLVGIDRRIASIAILAITAIGGFFMQVLPILMGDGVRAWLLVRRGCDLRNTVTSIAIDRGVSVGGIIALTIVILLLPSSLSALGGYRDLVLIVNSALLLAGLLVLMLLPKFIPLFERFRYLRWIAGLAADTRRVILGPKGLVILGLACLIDVLTIALIWCLGRAQGLMLPVSDAAVLFVVMIGVTLVPISINGWGLREVAVVAVLGRHGIAPEQSLVFSVCFGLALAAGSAPGALVWLLYSVAPPGEGHEAGRAALL